MKTRIFIFAFAISMAGAAQAQLITNSFTGDVQRNGSPFAGGDINAGDQLRIGVDSANPSGSLSFSPQAQPNSFVPGRYEMQFRADNNGANVFLPSGRDGATSIAGLNETRYFSTWDTNFFGQTPDPHTFSMTADTVDGSGGIDVEVLGAITPTRTVSAGSFIVDRLDNSIYDTDADVGDIVVNTSLTPIITLNFTLPQITATRGNVDWGNGAVTASAFRDDTSTSMWFLLGNQIFSTPFSPSVTFAAGEGDATKIVNTYSGTITMDWSTVATGTYTGRSWSIDWNTYGYDNEIGGLSIGGIHQSFDDAAISIVPEPATFAALGLGLLALKRRRR